MVLAVAGALSSGAAISQTPSLQDLQQALALAQKAAVDAQRAALQAQDALAQIQQASADARQSTVTAKASGGGSIKQMPGEGIVYKNGGDSVRLYGLIDLSFSRRSNADKAGDHQTDMPVAWFSGNRWGVKS